MFTTIIDSEASQPLREPPVYVALHLQFGQHKRAEIECARSLVRLTRLMPITVSGEGIE